MNSITGVPYTTNYLNDVATNPMVIIVLTVVILAYYALFAGLGMASGKSAGEAAMSAGKVLYF